MSCIKKINKSKFAIFNGKIEKKLSNIHKNNT